MKPNESEIDAKIALLFAKEQQSTTFNNAEFSQKLIKRIQINEVSKSFSISFLKAIFLVAIVGLVYLLPKSLSNLTELYAQFGRYFGANTNIASIIALLLLGLFLKLQGRRSPLI